MKPSSTPYRRGKLTFRWRGRRWYDPNEIKLLWSTISLFLVSGAIRMAVLAFASTHSSTLEASAVPPPRGIIGTAHDLSATGLHRVTNSSATCVFCHTPHRGGDGINQNIPIWNHATTSVQFVMYASPGVKGAVDSQPVGPSLACLSCHDGTVAMGALHEIPKGGGQDDYSQAEGGINPVTGTMQGDNRIGSDLSSVHPVSITYRDDLNKALRPPGELVGVRLFPSNVRGAKVQCASCHDPHNFGEDGSTAPFLRVTQRGSALCLSCHMV